MSRLLASLAAAALLTGLATPIASAEPLALQCVGAKTTKFSPGLTLEEKPTRISFTASYAPCLGTATSITSATQVDSVEKAVSCLSLGEANHGTSVFDWNTGETSEFTYESRVERPAGQLTTTKRGTITSGKFAGATVVEVAVGVSPGATDCLSPEGMQTIGSTIELTITGL